MEVRGEHDANWERIEGYGGVSCSCCNKLSSMCSLKQQKCMQSFMVLEARRRK